MADRLGQRHSSSFPDLKYIFISRGLSLVHVSPTKLLKERSETSIFDDSLEAEPILLLERKEPWEDMELECGGKGAAKGNGEEIKPMKAWCWNMESLFHVPGK